MQAASSDTVLGDFNNAEFSQFGITSTFYRQQGKFMVRTDGAGGAMQDFEIRYSFGVDPLQQYLIDFPGIGFADSTCTLWSNRIRYRG